jgi:hypothetical protein
MLEAICHKCDQMFNPADEDDTIHLVKVGEYNESTATWTQDEECGGEGEITGEWR